MLLLAAIVLLFIEVAWAIRINNAARHSLNTLVSEGRALFAWSEDGHLTVVLVAGLAGLAIVMIISANGWFRRRLAWIALVVFGLALTGVNLSAQRSVQGGYVDGDGARWIDRNGVVDAKPWSEASRVYIACSYSKGLARLRHYVVFGRRRAELSGVGFVGPGRAGAWLRRLAPIERALPRDIRVIRAGLDHRCLSAYARGLDQAEIRSLVALYRPTRVHARSMSKRNPAWGRILEEVASSDADPLKAFTAVP